MARSRSTSSRKKTHRTSILSRVIWIVWTLVTGGSVAGWMAPGIPLLGPLVQQVMGNKTINKTVTDILNDERVNEVISLAPDQAWQGKVGLLKKKLAEQKASSQTPGGQGLQVPTSSGVQAPTSSRTTPGAPVQKSPDKIGIATYNIQVFGNSKLAKTWIVDILAQVVRRLDVVAIQEIRSKDDQVMPEFIAAVNADGSRYDYVIGPRLGRTVSTEQYAFVFDTNRIEVDRSSVGTMSDPDDLLHREPLVARFRTRTNSAGAPFSFWLVNIHTDPDEVASEVDVLAGVFQLMQTARADEDDVILLGDLNASDREFGRLGQVPGITWAVTGTTTNTRKNKMYDNILFSRFATTEFTGRWGVADIQTVFGLTLDQALEVSDHFPVWAEFSIWEAAPVNNTAQRPGHLFQ
jgi:deoxyribonuclease-1-like protein